MPRNIVRALGAALALLALVTMLAPGAAWAGRAELDPDGATAKARAELDPDGAPVALRTSTEHRAGFDPDGRV